MADSHHPAFAEFGESPLPAKTLVPPLPVPPLVASASTRRWLIAAG